MKGLNAKELLGQEPTELRRTLRKLEEDLFKHKMKKTTNQLENVMLIRNTRRDIARINTVLAQQAKSGGSAQAATQAATKEGEK